MTITRKEWSQAHLTCMACARTSRCGGGYDEELGPWWLETHEIARGPHRAKALEYPAAWLQLCNHCHAWMDGAPIVVQLALKKMHDPEHYDRVKVNLLRHRRPDAITEEEVARVVMWMEQGKTIEECKRKLG